MLVFSFNQSKPKAIAPIIGGILVGMAADTLVTMGVKAISKATLKRKADDYAAQAMKNGQFDFMGTNPYRNKDGSITLSPSATDWAKMAGLIGGSLAGTMLGSGLDSNGNPVVPDACYPVDRERVQIKEQILDPAVYGQAAVTMRKTTFTEVTTYFVGYKYELSENLYQYELLSRLTGTVMYTGQSSKSDLTFVPESLNTQYGNYRIRIALSDGVSNSGVPTGELDGKVFKQGKITDSVSLAQSMGEKIMVCDGLAFPSTVQQIPVLDMSKNYNLQNVGNTLNRTMIINNVYPPSDSEGEVTWGDVEDMFADDPSRFVSIMDDNIGNYLEKGDLLINPITIEEINNDYTKVGAIQEVEPQLPTVPPGGELSPVEPINRGMLQVMKESYQFLADGIENSIQSMKTVTDKSMGLINYLDTAFRWLPAEWRAMFGAAFVLGVFAHFFRR